MSIDIEDLLRNENAAWNAHDTDKITEFYTDDCVKEDVAVGVYARGKEQTRAVINSAFAAVTDMKIELKLVFYSGNLAASEWIMSGTFSGVFPGIPPVNNAPFSIKGASIMVLRDGKISRVSDYWDFSSLLRQAGSITPKT